MKYYQEFAQKMILSFGDVETIVGNRYTAARIVADYAEKGLLIKIRKNLYAAASLENGGFIPNENQIGCALKPNAFISHHSAFVFYGYYNQVYSTVDVSAPTRFENIVFGGKEYRHHHSTWLEQVETVGNALRVTTMERTIVDSIKDMKKAMELEELIRCVEMVPWIKEKVLINVLSAYDNHLLWKKVGFLLKNCIIKFELTDSFFEACRRNGGNSLGYFFSDEKTSQHYDKEWGLYVPSIKNDQEVSPDVLI
jgi:predicted transcriptional regulator of viral defense system